MSVWGWGVWGEGGEWVGMGEEGGRWGKHVLFWDFYPPNNPSHLPTTTTTISEPTEVESRTRHIDIWRFNVESHWRDNNSQIWMIQIIFHICILVIIANMTQRQGKTRTYINQTLIKVMIKLALVIRSNRSEWVCLFPSLSLPGSSSLKISSSWLCRKPFSPFNP